jgi:hypothetical protein
MKRFLPAAASLMLLATPALAGELPTEEQKAEALKCAAYILSSGKPLIGPHGMIDMTDKAVVEACAVARANAAVALPLLERNDKPPPSRKK